MTFGFTQEAGLVPEPGASHQLIECAWFLTSLDDATEKKISAIVRNFAARRTVNFSARERLQ
jgi:hypothetical protein